MARDHADVGRTRRAVPLVAIRAVFGTRIPRTASVAVRRPRHQGGRVGSLIPAQHHLIRLGSRYEHDTARVLDGPSIVHGVVEEGPKIRDLGPDGDELAESIMPEFGPA